MPNKAKYINEILLKPDFLGDDYFPFASGWNNPTVQISYAKDSFSSDFPLIYLLKCFILH